MPRTLRTKNGCFTCRIRRKKCDEIKPICTGCQRNYLTCNWPRYENQSLSSFISEQDENLLLLESSQSTLLENEKNNVKKSGYKDSELLNFILGPFVDLIAPESIKDRVKAHFLSQARRSPAFFTISECLGRKYVENDNDVTDDLYVETLALIKRELDSTGHNIREDWILNIITFFIFRELGKESPQLLNITSHIRASFELISERILSGATSFGLLISADSFLFHYPLVVLCCTEEMESQIPNSLVVEKVWAVLYGSSRHNRDLNPLLANNCLAYMDLCHATHILRFPQPNNVVLAKAILKRVERTILRKDSPFKTAVLLSVKLVLLYVIYGNDSSLADHVQKLEAPFLEALSNAEDEELRIFGAWPMTACALICSTQESRDALVSIYDRARDRMNPLWFLLRQMWSQNTGLNALADNTVMEKMFFRL